VVLGVVVGVVSLVGIVLRLVNPTYEEREQDFVEAAREQLADVRAAEAHELFMDEIVDSSSGVPARLDELLTVDGRSPERVQAIEPRGVEAVYRIEAWDGDGLVVVRLDPHGLEIDTD
jgi:hypothetical protein